MKSAATLSAAMALLAGTTDAFWRMGCHSRTAFLRLDPIVEPGTISNHGHVIHGGSNFGETTTYEDLRSSECTSCLFKDDMSAYWTPSLHFIHENGTTEAVPQVGGMLAYYLLFGKDIKAFPPGFQMLAGDTRLRNFSGPVPDPEKSLWGPEDKTQHALAQKSLGFNCLDYEKAPEGSMYRHFLPDKEFLDGNCKNGIRAEIFFPSCWNGKDLKSDNNKDHVAYPDLINSGDCPEGYDTRLPSLFYETIWNTFAFAGVPGTFTWANGDPTGYGYHGDFMMGWNPDVLQRAVNECTNESGVLTDCPVFTENNGLQTEEEGRQCKIQTIPEILKDDNCDGPADGLCGNVPVQNGPNYASLLQPGGTEAPTAAPVPTDVAPVPTLSYQSARSMITDEYGGGISVYDTKGEPTKPADAAAPAPTAEAPPAEAPPAEAPPAEAAPPAAPPAEVVPAAAPPAEAPPANASPAPAVTPAPAAPAGDAPKGSIIGTSTYTSAGQVYEVAIEEVVVYVTVEAPSARKHRRHVHHPHHRMGLRHTF